MPKKPQTAIPSFLDRNIHVARERKERVERELARQKEELDSLLQLSEKVQGCLTRSTIPYAYVFLLLFSKFLERISSNPCAWVFVCDFDFHNLEDEDEEEDGEDEGEDEGEEYDVAGVAQSPIEVKHNVNPCVIFAVQSFLNLGLFKPNTLLDKSDILMALNRSIDLDDSFEKLLRNSITVAALKNVPNLFRISTSPSALKQQAAELYRLLDSYDSPDVNLIESNGRVVNIAFSSTRIKMFMHPANMPPEHVMQCFDEPETWSLMTWGDDDKDTQ